MSQKDISVQYVRKQEKPSEKVIALAGNPNTGKSTIFNAFTGLRQHTGNWPGKTISRAEGYFEFADQAFKIIDLPGTYSLLATSTDEVIARDFILFGKPDCTLIIADGTALERNLHLALQILEITDQAILVVNLLDEARRRRIEINIEALSGSLGIPVVATCARTGKGLDDLLKTVDQMVAGKIPTLPRRIPLDERIQQFIEKIVPHLKEEWADLQNPSWVAVRLLDDDHRIQEALLNGDYEKDFLKSAQMTSERLSRRQHLFDAIHKWRKSFPGSIHDHIVNGFFKESEKIVANCVVKKGYAFQNSRILDRLLTSPITGLPIMMVLLAVVFWITITGANVPSQWLAKLLFLGEDKAAALFDLWGAPWWLTGILWHGIYRCLAWVVSVMLPPMAIFFPLFTILEDFGLLPRVAFNLDRVFRKVGAHGKQALTMSMGFGCNAAGVIAARIIDSPRERLIAILTNNFMICNGRFPTMIILANIFVAASFPAWATSLAAVASIMAIVILGILITLIVSMILSRTILKGEASMFTLELPPYRRPNILRTLYSSLIDRTLFVLNRAIMMAIPAGAVIWLIGNVSFGGQSIANHMGAFLDPFGQLLGLDGVILLAYIVAIPANEIVLPTILMLYSKSGMMFELNSLDGLRAILVEQEGWTLLTAVCLMIFSLNHNPCSTTILTIWKETRSIKWTVLATVMPLVIGFTLCFLIAQSVRFFF